MNEEEADTNLNNYMNQGPSDSKGIISIVMIGLPESKLSNFEIRPR